MSYQMIASEGKVGSIAVQCHALGVSVSGYYAWRTHQPSQHQQTDAALLAAIRAVYQAGRG